MLWEWLLDNYLDTEMNARIRGVDVNMHKFDYVFKVYLDDLSSVTVIIWANLYKTPTCLTSMVGVLPMLLWKHWKVLKMMRISNFFGKTCCQIPRDWMWTSQLIIDRSPNLDLRRTIFDIGTAKKQPHMPQRSVPQTLFRSLWNGNQLHRRLFGSGGYQNVRIGKICSQAWNCCCCRSCTSLNWCLLPLLQTLPVSSHSAQCDGGNRTWKSRWLNNGWVTSWYFTSTKSVLTN